MVVLFTKFIAKKWIVLTSKIDQLFIVISIISNQHLSREVLLVNNTSIALNLCCFIVMFLLPAFYLTITVGNCILNL